MCVLKFSTDLSGTFLIPRNIQSDTINVQSSSRKPPSILVIFSWNFNFLYISSTNPQLSIWKKKKIRPAVAELFHADRQTRSGEKNVIVASRIYVNAPKKGNLKLDAAKLFIISLLWRSLKYSSGGDTASQRLS